VIRSAKTSLTFGAALPYRTVHIRAKGHLLTVDAALPPELRDALALSN
jgi:hypothetical protein